MGEALGYCVSNFVEKTGEMLSFVKYEILVILFSVVMSFRL